MKSKKAFYIIWIGQAFSQLSSSVLQFAIVWYLVDQTKSGSVLTMAMLMGYLPQGLLGPFVGVYIDRFNRKFIMIASDVVVALASLMLVFVSVNGAIPIPIVLGVLLIRAIGTAFHNPTLQAVTPQLVPEEELTKCSGYTQSLQAASMIISPAIAGVLYSAWSLDMIVVLDVVGAVFAGMMVLLVKIPKHKGMDNKKKIKVIREAKEGLDILCKKQGMLGLTLISSLYTIALMPISALFPLMCMKHFGGTSDHASVVEIVFALGYLVGALILGRWGGTKNKIYTIFWSYIGMAFALIISGLLPESGYAIFVMMAAIMGIVGPFYWGMYTPILQRNFAEEYLGRVLSITGSIRLIAGPLALVISGILADVIGEEKWFLVAGVLVVICSVIIIANPSIRNCDASIEKKV